MKLDPRNLPCGGREIAELRAIGKRPADMVLVSLLGPLNESNPVVRPEPGRRYDWRFLVDLPVLIVVRTDSDDLAGVVKAIDSIAPASLVVWFADHQNGVNLVIEGHRPSTKDGRRLDIAQRVSYAGLGSPLSEEKCRDQIAAQVKARVTANADQLDATLMEMAIAGFSHHFGKPWEAA